MRHLQPAGLKSSQCSTVVEGSENKDDTNPQSDKESTEETRSTTSRHLEYRFAITAYEPEQTIDHVLCTNSNLPRKEALSTEEYDRIVSRCRSDDMLTKMIVFREFVYHFHEFHDVGPTDENTNINDALSEASGAIFVAIDEYVEYYIREVATAGDEQ